MKKTEVKDGEFKAENEYLNCPGEGVEGRYKEDQKHSGKTRNNNKNTHTHRKNSTDANDIIGKFLLVVICFVLLTISMTFILIINNVIDTNKNINLCI